MAWGKPDPGADSSKPSAAVLDWCKRLERGDEKLSHLSIMSFRSLSDADVEALCRVLASNTSLKTLSIMKALSEGQLKQLSDMLAVNKGITSICIGTSSLGDKGLAILSSGMAENRTITHLDLENKGLTDASAPALKTALSNQLPLTRLSICRNSFTDASAGAISEALNHLPALEVLDISENNFGCELSAQLASVVTNISSVKEVKMSGCKRMFQDRDAALRLCDALASLPGLTRLDVSGCADDADTRSHLSQGLSRVLEHTASLEALVANDCGIDEDDIDHFKDALHSNTSLRHVALSANKLGQNGAVKLVESGNLQNLDYLDLSKNDVLDIRNVLPYLRGIQQLRFFGNPLSSSIAAMLMVDELGMAEDGQGPGASLLRCLDLLTELQDLDLGGTGLDHSMCRSICSLLLEHSTRGTSLQVLSLGGNKIDSRDEVEELTLKLLDARNLKLLWS